MELQIEIIGYLLILLSCIHVIFPKYFGWKEDLAPLQQINRSMMKVHTFFIALTVFLMGLLCVTSAEDLLQTELGRKICLGLGLFWLIRLFFQFFIYPSSLWKGRRLETVIHIVAIVFWVFLTYSFLWGYFSQWN
ncbi:hypothetical protein [Sphingobacterium sp.]|uniref:hypothetical protein n=1 Tax=Sphingobacterium sp. TaxID=341027 RepID=UPI0028AE1A8C|nr:hypothetical protein [Sphingobacterium sp.]